MYLSAKKQMELEALIKEIFPVNHKYLMEVLEDDPSEEDLFLKDLKALKKAGYKAKEDFSFEELNEYPSDSYRRSDLSQDILTPGYAYYGSENKAMKAYTFVASKDLTKRGAPKTESMILGNYLLITEIFSEVYRNEKEKRDLYFPENDKEKDAAYKIGALLVLHSMWQEFADNKSYFKDFYKDNESTLESLSSVFESLRFFSLETDLKKYSAWVNRNNLSSAGMTGTPSKLAFLLDNSEDDSLKGKVRELYWDLLIKERDENYSPVTFSRERVRVGRAVEDFFADLRPEFLVSVSVKMKTLREWDYYRKSKMLLAREARLFELLLEEIVLKGAKTEEEKANAVRSFGLLAIPQKTVEEVLKEDSKDSKSFSVSSNREYSVFSIFQDYGIDGSEPLDEGQAALMRTIVSDRIR